MKEFQLSSTAVLAGHHMRAYESAGSTNQMALHAAQAGEMENLWIVTDCQTAGKGRRGRKWQTAKGNLATSLFIKIPKETESAHLLGFVAAIALINTSKEFLGSAVKLTLKWPNDVLLGGAKLAGILLESAMLGQGMRGVIVGMGVNISNAPVDVFYKTAFITQLNADISPADFYEKLTKHWVESFSIWNFGQGKKTIIEQWIKLASGIGSPIDVNRTNDQISGTFESIDGEGRLILRMADGQKEVITAGDVLI